MLLNWVCFSFSVFLSTFLHLKTAKINVFTTKLGIWEPESNGEAEFKKNNFIFFLSFTIRSAHSSEIICFLCSYFCQVHNFNE